MAREASLVNTHPDGWADDDNHSIYHPSTEKEVAIIDIKSEHMQKSSFIIVLIWTLGHWSISLT